jgi:hypothetical protein
MRRGALLVAGCAAVAAASLLLPWALAFDPYAWLVWGRELTRGTLDTSAGPSFKPLPVLATTPLALTGDAAPELWLLTARTGALLAVAGAAVLAHRITGGYLAAATAATVLVISPWWWFNAALGNSEGLLAAGALWAAVAHLAGRPRWACAALLGAALLRPEIWPFLGLYGAWSWWAVPGSRIVVAASLALVPVLWFVPGLLGGGGASDAAKGRPSTGSAGLADFPFGAVLVDSVQLLTVPAALALAVALYRPRSRAVLWLTAAAIAYVLIVAVMTQAGYAGNPRYLVPAAALGTAVAASGAARLGAVAAVLLVLAVAGLGAGELRDQTRAVGQRADTRRGLDLLVGRTRGPIEACPRLRTSTPQRSAVAWTLDRGLADLNRPPRAPAAVLRARPFSGGSLEPPLSPPFAAVAASPGWELAVACP